MAKQKFYVVWNGAEDGVYTSWEACKEAVEGFSGAKYQAFKTEAEAEEAFEMGYEAWKEQEKEPRKEARRTIGMEPMQQQNAPFPILAPLPLLPNPNLPKPLLSMLHVQAIRARWNTGVCICAQARKSSITDPCGARTTSVSSWPLCMVSPY